LVTSSIVDRVLGCNYGETIRDAHIYLPSDPTEMMYLLGQCSTEDFNLASCQCAILSILYACSFYNERYSSAAAFNSPFTPYQRNMLIWQLF